MVLLLWVSAPEAIFERHDDLFDTSKADALDDILLAGGEWWIKRDRSSLQYTQRHGNDDMGAFEAVAVGGFEFPGRLGGRVLLNRES